MYLKLRFHNHLPVNTTTAGYYEILELKCISSLLSVKNKLFHDQRIIFSRADHAYEDGF